MSKSDVLRNIQHTRMYVSKGRVMTAGKLEQYYKNTEEWTMQHFGYCLREQPDLLNTMLSLLSTIRGSFMWHNFHTVLEVLPSSTWLCSWMYNSSGIMKATFLRMKFFKPKNLSHSFINQVRLENLSKQTYNSH
jgi:hypothetical protein